MNILGYTPLPGDCSLFRVYQLVRLKERLAWYFKYHVSLEELKMVNVNAVELTEQFKERSKCFSPYFFYMEGDF